MYLFWSTSVFVQIPKYICPDCWVYLCKFQSFKVYLPRHHPQGLLAPLFTPSLLERFLLVWLEKKNCQRISYSFTLHTTLLLKEPFTVLHIVATYHIIWHTCFHDSTMHIFTLCKHFWNAPLEVHLQSYTAHICTSFKLFRRQCVRQNRHCVSACAQSWHTQHKACYLPGSRGCWRIYKEMSTLAPGQVTLANDMSQCHCVNNRPKAPVTMQGTLDEGHGNSAVNLQWCLDFFCNHNMVIPSCVRSLLCLFHLLRTFHFWSRLQPVNLPVPFW